MVIEDDRIQQATEEELHIYWLRNWSDFCSWPEYKRNCIAAGTEITDAEVFGNDN